MDYLVNLVHTGLKTGVFTLIVLVKVIFKLKHTLNYSLQAINGIVTSVLSFMLLLSFFLLDILFGLLNYQKLNYNDFELLFQADGNVRIGNGFQTLFRSKSSIEDNQTDPISQLTNPGLLKRERVHWWKTVHNEENIPQLVPEATDEEKGSQPEPYTDRATKLREKFKRQMRLPTPNTALSIQTVGSQMKQLKSTFEPIDLKVIV